MVAPAAVVVVEAGATAGGEGHALEYKLLHDYRS